MTPRLPPYDLLEEITGLRTLLAAEAFRNEGSKFRLIAWRQLRSQDTRWHYPEIASVHFLAALHVLIHGTCDITRVVLAIAVPEG